MKAESFAAAVFTILSDVYDTSPWTLTQIESDMAQENTDYFFVYEEKKAVGFLAIQNLVGELEITNIAVLSDYQGKGYASQLMNYLENRSESIFLEVRSSNQAAQNLYQKYGFEKMGQRKHYYHNPTEDAVIMRRETK
ncbi:ribosomal protein S18-alanine N-acetyltransferase [Streptococcus dentiloxodontae]